MLLLSILAVIWCASALAMYAYGAMMIFANAARIDEAYQTLYVYPHVFLLRVMRAALPVTLPAAAYYLAGPVGLMMAINENRLDALKGAVREEMDTMRQDLIAEFNEAMAAAPEAPQAHDSTLN